MYISEWGLLAHVALIDTCFAMQACRCVCFRHVASLSADCSKTVEDKCQNPSQLELSTRLVRNTKCKVTPIPSLPHGHGVPNVMGRAPHGHQGWGPHVHGKYSPKTLLTVHSMLGQTFVATSAFAVFIFSQHAWTDLCCHIGLCCHYFATSAFGRPLFTACLDRPLLPHRPLLSLLCSILAHRHMLSR